LGNALTSDMSCVEFESERSGTSRSRSAIRLPGHLKHFHVVAVEVGKRQVIADAQGRTADGTWLTTL
jgi:hypothetical protein